MSKETMVLVGGALLLLGLGVWWMLARRPNKKLAPTLTARAEPNGDTLRAYSPQNVGNDASARPWEATAFNEISTQAALNGELAAGLPADFDTEDFLRASKDNFIRLQAAWDQADAPTLRALVTADMFGQIEPQLVAREAQQTQATSQTEVVMLEAKLLGVETLPTECMANVEFSGMIREEPGTTPTPFRELWSISRPQSAVSGWRVCSVQALQ